MGQATLFESASLDLHDLVSLPSSRSLVVAPPTRLHPQTARTSERAGLGTRLHPRENVLKTKFLKKESAKIHTINNMSTLL